MQPLLGPPDNEGCWCRGCGRELQENFQEQMVQELVKNLAHWAALAEHIALAAVDNHIEGVRLAALHSVGCVPTLAQLVSGAWL